MLQCDALAGGERRSPNSYRTLEQLCLVYQNALQATCFLTERIAGSPTHGKYSIGVSSIPRQSLWTHHSLEK
jgi:hypothetical protein